MSCRCGSENRARTVLGLVSRFRPGSSTPTRASERSPTPGLGERFARPIAGRARIGSGTARPRFTREEIAGGTLLGWFLGFGQDHLLLLELVNVRLRRARSTHPQDV